MAALGTALRLPAALVVAALNLGCWSWCRADRAALLSPGDRPGLPVLVAGVAAVVLQVALAWLLLLVVLVAVEPWAGRDLTTYAGCPSTLRPLLLACCGAAVLGVLAGPAQASAPLPHRPAHDTRSTSTQLEGLLEGLPLPDRTTGPGRLDPGGRTTLVRPGDTLWGIAERHLPEGAGAAAVDRAWRALYAANRAVIGPDPDLISPGTRLRLPDPPPQEDR